jgi:hypothetical protein
MPQKGGLSVGVISRVQLRRGLGVRAGENTQFDASWAGGEALKVDHLV